MHKQVNKQSLSLDKLIKMITKINIFKLLTLVSLVLGAFLFFCFKTQKQFGSCTQKEVLKHKTHVRLQVQSQQALPLLQQMESIFQQKEKIYNEWDKQKQQLKKSIEFINQLQAKVYQAMQLSTELIKTKLKKVFQLSPQKKKELDKKRFDIKQIERLKEHRFDRYQVARQKMEPNCTKIAKLPLNKNSIYLPDRLELQTYSLCSDLIIVTPVKQIKYLQILFNHLLKQKKSFYEWHLWVRKDRRYFYLNKLAQQNQWVKIIQLDFQNQKQNEINDLQFWQKDCQPNKIYLRIEDDTVWMSQNFLSRMFHARVKNPKNILIYGNIINNQLIDYLNQHAGNFNFNQIAHHHCEGTGWRSIQIVKQIHNQFLQSIQQNATQKWKRSFQKWYPISFQKISLNAVIYFSNTLNSLQIPRDKNQLQLFSVYFPFTYEIPNLIIGDAICVNYAYDYQKNFLDRLHPQILENYKNYSLLQN